MPFAPSNTQGYVDFQYQPPALATADSGLGKISLTVTAGSDGAPEGFTVWWMEETDYVANGRQWYPAPNAIQREAVFSGRPTVNTWGASHFRLAPNQRATVEIGDLLDETGVTTDDPEELEEGTRYVFAVFTNGGARMQPSDRSADLVVETTPAQPCLETRAGWAGHPQSWPISVLFLGNLPYGKAELLSILQQPASTNGLVILARQLIAAKLNILHGADPRAIEATVATADALIGFQSVPPVGSDWLAPEVVTALAQALDDFNHGVGTDNPCETVSVRQSSWGAVKSAYR